MGDVSTNEAKGAQSGEPIVGSSPARQRLPHPVIVADRIPRRLRRPEDLFEALFCTIGIVLVVILGIFAHATTQGVTEDVRLALGTTVQQILRLPVTLIESLFVLIAPLMVLFSLARRQRFRSIVEVIITGMVSALVGWGITAGLPLLPRLLVDSLLIRTPRGDTISLDVILMVLIAGLTVAGDSGTMRSIRYSWYGVWVLLVVQVIWGTTTVPGMVVTVLLGRVFGLLARWVLGFDDRRALPADLVEAVLDMGFIPTRIVRCDLPTDVAPLETWEVSESNQDPDLSTARINRPLETRPAPGADASYTVTPQLSTGADRHYQMWDEDGTRLDLHVLDPVRAITGTLGELWNHVRLRGIARWVSPTIKANAERSVLTASSAAAAGTSTPIPFGIAEAGDSVVILWQALPPVAPLLALADNGNEISNALLDQAWLQLRCAHRRSISHRNLDFNAVVVDSFNNLWILDWNQGDVATTELNQHIDCAQMLVHLTLAVGEERATDSAIRHFSRAELIAISMVMQSAVLPPDLRSRMRRTKVLVNLRTKLADMANTSPEEVAPIKLERFAPRTIVMFVIGAVALVAVLTSLNFEAILSAVKDANAWWILVSFLIGCTTWVGAAIPLVSFAPVKIRLRDATLAQMAASLATIVAPAGIGPAALNLRFLTKQKMKMPAAVATVTLVQISQFLTSVILLLTVAVVTGTSLSLPTIPAALIWVVVALVAIILALLAVPQVRRWIWAKAKPTWDQVYPQLVWVVAHPKELLIALGGNLLMNLGYIGAFATALMAFNYSLSPITITMTYLISNTLGSVVPAPGGIGPVEAALTGGLQVAGIPTAVAISTAVIFRVVTFYGRIPFGWIAMHYSQKKGLI